MSDSGRSVHTPPLSLLTRKRKGISRSVSPPSKRQRSRSQQSRGRPRIRHESRDRKMARRYRRHDSTRSERRRNRRMGRSRTRTKHQYGSRKRCSISATSSSHSSNRSRTDSLSSIDSTCSSETSLSSSRRSRSRSRRSKTNRHGLPSRRSHKKTDVMDRFIDAISNHGRNSFVGAHDVIPAFDPSQRTQSTQSWLKKVNETAAIYRWSSKQTIFHALPKLTGLARRWYEGLSSVNLTWKQWQRKLLQHFPDDRNYADRLTEMLSRRSRKDETLEEYFYDKAKLVSHCNIKGKDAVDCIIHGIFDHNIKLNAQGANFKSPEKLLKYLRSITVKSINKDIKKPNTTMKYSNLAKNNENNKDNKSSVTTSRICYNCAEPGHTAPRCRKEAQKCTKCNRLGHLVEYCRQGALTESRKHTPKADSSNVNKIQKLTARNEPGNNIYNKIIKLNDKTKSAFIDFGSQCTVLKQSIAEDLNLSINYENLPLIKGFALGTLKPIGKVQVHIKIDFVSANVEAFVIPDEFLSTDVLIGQNMTEMSDVVVFKTNASLILYSDKATTDKMKLFIQDDVVVKGMQTVRVRCDRNYTGLIYLPGNISFKNGGEIMTLPGVYHIKESKGEIPVVSLTNEKISLAKDKLLARVCLLPLQDDSLPSYPTEFQVNKMSLSNTINHNTDSKTITLDMLNIGSDLTQEQEQGLLTLLNEFRDCFALDLNELGTTNITEMHIQLHDDAPVSYKPYRLPYSERIIVRDIINELLDTNIIQESDSSYASPIVLVKKKSGEHRLCVDYRALNKKTVKNSFPMPVIDDQLDRLSDKVYFTSLDLKSGYYQIPMAEGSRHLTAFVTPDGHYEYTRMPFGLVNAPAVFQHMINKALGKDRYDLAIPYMDDLLSPAASINEGLDKLRKILISLRNAGLTLNLSKCYFFKRELDYLGYEVSCEGLRPGTKKIEAVASFPTPVNVHQIRQFVGLASFFRRFIPGFASIAKPLTMLTKSNVPWKWGSEQEIAFQEIKSKLVERPILALYNPEYMTEVHCDASKLGVGGILLQKQNEKDPLKPVAYFSKQTTKDEEHFHSYELETLAVVLSLRKFRTYLIGIPFKVYTDCNALRTTLTKRDLIPRIARWWLLLQEYNFTVEYRPGESMRHVDALSRNPTPNTNLNSEKDEMDTYEIMSITTTTEWLQSVQMTDPKLKLVNAILSSDSKDIKDILENYVLREGKIYRNVNGELKWVVPNNARWRICQLSHDEAGHFSVDKTLSKIKQDYWFPKMNRFVRKYVTACMNCQYNKASTSKSSGYLHPIPKGNIPFHTLHMDHLGPFVRSKRGNSYILGIIDGFSKFIFVKAVKDLKSKTTVKILSDIFSVIGSPKVIISDRGTSFTSTIFKNYVKSIGAKHVLNAVATPRANGQIERYNRTILESLAASNHGLDERDWDTHINKVQWSLNNTRNKSTGTTPSEVVFGRNTTNPSEGPVLNSIQNSIEDVSADNSQPDNVNDTPEMLRDKIRNLTENNIKENQRIMKERYDSKKAPTKFFALGDLVMIPNYHTPANGKSKKLYPKFRGPFRVSAIHDNDRYEISSIDGYSKRKYKSVYPADALKKWITFTDDKEDDDYNVNMDDTSEHCSETDVE
ncbi:hypothetical protein ABMA28_015295 [Loxostege sticticalis]|uniref:RNA-directed DNA polymerase n=1 Tax=Loxostege sticticalis TaxID=481309 RepID=A0ABD0TEW3_LOXSC